VDELPRGTVTFLFTDIEGSTRLLQRLGERYSNVLGTHRRILREAVSAHDGHEVDTQGDSFFFVFARANAAVAAAISAQRGLAAHEWPDDGEVRVRMGLHTGEPIFGDERYVGLGVHRAARIGAVGHGGQILLSSATSELVDDEAAGVSIRDLGSYRLKDLDRPERLYQLDVDGLETAFPPLKAQRVAEARPLRRRATLLAALAGVIAAAVAVPIFAFGGGGQARSAKAAEGDSLAVVDAASGRLVADIGLRAAPSHVAVGEDAYWVTNADDRSVSRIDPASDAVVQTVTVGNNPSGVASGEGAVWVTNSLDGTVSRIDPVTNTVVQQIRVGNLPVGIVVAAGAVWVANTGDNTITRIDAATGSPTKTLPVAATELASGAGSVWASDRGAGRLTRIDPTTGDVVQAIPVGNDPIGVAVGKGAAWVANSLDGTVSRVDTETNSVGAVIPVGDGPVGVAIDSRGVWVTNQFGGTLVRIDAATSQVTRTISVGNRPQGVTTSGDDVLVAVQQSGAGHRGGTLTMRMNRDVDSIDTAVAYDTTSWPFLRMTGDGLVAFNQAGGLAGAQLVPDLAISLPRPTDGGKTYAFRLRPGVRYSTGRVVQASDVRATLERGFKLRGPSQYYDGILGAARCRQTPRRCDLSRGIVTNDAAGTVTFHLAAPDPDFLSKLALPFAYVQPAGTPARIRTTAPSPATGPYVIARYRPKRVLRLVRNPQFREWSKAAQPDGYPDSIVVKIGGTADDAVDDVISGRADVFSTAQSQTPPSERRLAALRTRYASQVHTNPQPATIALFLNTRLAPFDRVDVRRALNYAADRAAAVRVVGGTDVARPTCQVVPPGFPGFKAYCPYTPGGPRPSWTKPDLAKARALVAASGTRGMKVTVWSWGDIAGLGPYAVKLLRSLGYRASLKVRGGSGYFSVIDDSRTKAQVGTYEWVSDYPAASAFLLDTMTCSSFIPRSPLNSNVAQFCNPTIDRHIKQALAQQAANPEPARGRWERIDHEIVDQAPWVPLVNPRSVDVLAKRVGNYQFSPAGAGVGVLIDQLWVR
jgi:YVTN family beta-propeller protein